MVRYSKKTARRRTKSINPEESHAWSQVMVKGSSIEDRSDVSEQSIRRRLMLMTSVMLIFISLLGVRLFAMQVVASNEYRELANGNRVRENITYAPRGRIFDRNGKLLADNALEFQLSVTPHLLDEDDAARANAINKVARVVGLKSESIEKEITRNGLEYVLPVPIEANVSHEQALRLEAMAFEVPGFSVDRVPSRTYVSDSALAHIIGYTGRVSEYDLEQDTTGEILPTDYIGKTGVELSFDDRLRGQNGWTRFEVDALGRPVRVIDSRAPTTGEDITLSIDYEVQKSMASAIAKQMKTANTPKGSGVTIDPVSGEVLALVSLPSYDNNKFIGGISQAEFDVYNKDANQPLFNKAYSGAFTTGSIIKPLVASAALQEGVVNENTIIVDGGFIDVVGEYGGTFRFRGWRESGLGPMNVRSALAWSSNIYFYTVGGGHGGQSGLGEERLTRYYRDFGLGESSGMNLPDETFGRVPDNEWKLENVGEPWYVGDSYNISIGQGDMLVSPLQITMAEAAIANGGSLLVPQIEKTDKPVVRRKVSVDPAYLQIVREGMRQVLTGGTTCECTFSEVGQVVAGKSGTAETNTPDGRRPHAWFTAFAPYEVGGTTPEVLSTVLIEEGVGGSQFAAPAIAETFKTYFAQ